MNKPIEIRLYGRVFIRGAILAQTGLHIGKGKEGIMIGGVDNAVIRDPLTNQPYIPGSSLKGKLRSLTEKRYNLPQNFKMDQVRIHVCSTWNEYMSCQVCRIYGVPGQMASSMVTRLVVRDIYLSGESVARLRAAETDQPYTEVKYEVAINRVTSEAKPRPLERVPAGSRFEPFEMIFSVYDPGDIGLIPNVFEAMHLLEDDYLGGSGSRGSGKIVFQALEVEIKPVTLYQQAAPVVTSYKSDDLAKLIAQQVEIQNQVRVEILTVVEKKKDE